MLNGAASEISKSRLNYTTVTLQFAITSIFINAYSFLLTSGRTLSAFGVGGAGQQTLDNFYVAPRYNG